MGAREGGWISPLPMACVTRSMSFIIPTAVCAVKNKMDSLKILDSTKVIILAEKKRKEVAWLGFELTTSISEGKSANHYTMDPS